MNKKNGYHYAGAGATAGATAGLIKGGAIGVAAFGGAVGLPLVVVGAGVGLLAGLGVKAIVDLCSDEENNEDKKSEY